MLDTFISATTEAMTCILHKWKEEILLNPLLLYVIFMNLISPMKKYKTLM